MDAEELRDLRATGERRTSGIILAFRQRAPDWGLFIGSGKLSLVQISLDWNAAEEICTGQRQAILKLSKLNSLLCTIAIRVIKKPT